MLRYMDNAQVLPFGMNKVVLRQKLRKLSVLDNKRHWDKDWDFHMPDISLSTR